MPAMTRHPDGRFEAQHGESGTPEYSSWSRMINRCTNENSPQFPSYGARGITVCERWLTFENFRADMGERPAGKSLDRIDGSRGYEPGNVRWATSCEQNQNRWNNKLTGPDAVAVVEAVRRGERRVDVARRFGLSLSTVGEVVRGEIWSTATGIARVVGRGRWPKKGQEHVE